MARLRYAGFKEESAYNEAPVAAAFHVDIASATLDAPADHELVYAGGIHGRAAKTRRPGFYSPSGNVVHACDISTIGWFLKWTLGGYKFTTSVLPALRKHEMYGTDDPVLPSFSTRLGKDLFEHIFRGCGIASLELNVEDGFAQLTANILAAQDGTATIAAVSSLKLPTAYPMTFEDVTVAIDGDADSAKKVKSLNLVIDNGLDASAGRQLGSKHPNKMLAGERTVTADLSLYFADVGEISRFWGHTAGPGANGASEFALTITLDAGTDGSLEISLPKAFYTSLGTQPSGKEELVQAAKLRAMASEVTLADGVTKKFTEILATLQNVQEELK